MIFWIGKNTSDGDYNVSHTKKNLLLDHSVSGDDGFLCERTFESFTHIKLKPGESCKIKVERIIGN